MKATEEQMSTYHGGEWKLSNWPPYWNEPDGTESHHGNVLRPGETGLFGNVIIKNNGTIPVHIREEK